jgi:hypothetical protein
MRVDARPSTLVREISQESRLRELSPSALLFRFFLALHRDHALFFCLFFAFHRDGALLLCFPPLLLSIPPLNPGEAADD